jgi:general secretion pathway protein D
VKTLYILILFLAMATGLIAADPPADESDATPTEPAPVVEPTPVPLPQRPLSAPARQPAPSLPAFPQPSVRVNPAASATTAAPDNGPTNRLIPPSASPLTPGAAVAPVVPAPASLGVPLQARPTPIPPAATNPPAAPGLQPPAGMASSAGSAPAASALGSEINAAGRLSDNPDFQVWDFNEAPLNQILKVYSELTGRTVLRGAGLAANQITIRTQTPLTRTEAIQAIESILALNKITLLPVGEKFVKVVNAAEAQMEAKPFSESRSEDLPEADQYVTQIVRLTNALPSEVVGAIQPFSKNPQGIVAIESSKMFVLRDYAANVKRMLEVIERVDVIPERDYKLEVIPIKFGRVEEIYSTMSSLIGGGGGGAVGGASGTGTTAARGRATRSSGRSTMGMQQTRTGQFGQTTQPGQTAAPSQSSFQQRLTSIVNRAAMGDVQLLGDAKIVPDARSNTLIVFANKEDMEMITNIVAKVDVLLAQVLIDSVIMDVSLGKSQDLGVSAIHNPQESGKWTFGGAMNNTLLSLATNISSANAPGGFSYFGKYSDDLSIIVRAIASDNRAEVLQAPRIQTSHAVPASFFNGRTVPYPTSSYYGGMGYGGSSQYQPLEVGVGLDVTPYLTPDGLVVMEVTQTIDEISGSTKIENVGDIPNTTKREATSTVSVKSGETILLGGFIRTNKERSKSGVPYLKDLPVLGGLFRQKSDKSDRSELIILLRPTIIPTPEEAAHVAKQELEKLPGVAEMKRQFEEDEAIRREESKKPSKRSSKK